MANRFPGRVDLNVIFDLVDSGSRVLDLGCGDGALLFRLVREKNVIGRGIEKTDEGVQECVAKGLSVLHGDLDAGLRDYNDKSFDFVILSLTLQEVRKPLLVLNEICRVGKRAIVSFPNYGHWRLRLGLLFKGRMPRSKILPEKWYETPNIHLCTVQDFRELCKELGIKILKEVYLKDQFTVDSRFFVRKFPNLFAGLAIFVISK
ncbi:MAG: methionine biosynthesis protein MetW [Candidatus Methanomethyliaceae archaeon]